MSEMTVEQAIHCIKTDIGIDNCDCFNCTMKTICEYGEDYDLGKDYSKVAHKIAIQALEENEILHELVEDYQRQFEMMQEENKKLKEEMEFYDKYIEREEFNKLKEENERLKKSRDDFAEASSRYYTELQALKSQLSAVEVLEWFCTSCRDSRGEVFDGKEAYTEIFLDFTPQEIVDKITEYQKSKAEPVSNSDEFNVGDIVYHNGRNFKVKEVKGRSLHCVNDNEDYWLLQRACKLVKHAEPTKNKLTIKDFHIGNCVKTEDGIGYISDILKSLIMVKYPDKELPQSYNPTFDYIEKIEQPKEEKRTCDNCKYEDTLPTKTPCCNCDEARMWEKQEEPQKNAYITNLEFETVPPQWDGRDSKLMWDKVNQIIDIMNKERV